MSTVTYVRESNVRQYALFSFTSDGSAQSVSLGFKPAMVKIINETDTIAWEKFANMAAANSFKTVNHDTTQIAVDTNSQILINTDGTITLGATLVGTSKAIKGIALA